MPRLYSARTIISALKRAGFLIISQKGSHIKLQKSQESKACIVIVPNHKEIATGTFSSILKQARMTKKEFERFVK